MDTCLKGATILIIEPVIESALDLQDHLADEGATVLTAYRKGRAFDLVQCASLKGVVIENSVYVDDAELRVRLHGRNIPHVVYRRAMPVAAVVMELIALINTPPIAAIDRTTRKHPLGQRAVVARSDEIEATSYRAPQGRLMVDHQRNRLGQR